MKNQTTNANRNRAEVGEKVVEVFAADWCEVWFEKLHKSGGVSDYSATVPCLWRAKLDPLLVGVEWQLVGYVHASARRFERDGAPMLEISGIGRFGRAFGFEIESQQLKNTRRFSGEFHNAAGAGTFIMPGFMAAFIRYLESSLENKRSF